jgi:hypothetical protein
MNENTEANTHLPSINGYHAPQNAQNNDEGNESFTISAEEAAQILGVNRSRLSQLTQKGVFAFERRKIETRNRLFYRLNDILSHQRSQIGLQQLIPQPTFSQTKAYSSPEPHINQQELLDSNSKQHASSYLKSSKNAVPLREKQKILRSAQEMHHNIKQNQAYTLNNTELQTIKEIINKQDITLKILMNEKSKTDHHFDHKIQQNLHSITHCKNILNLLKQDIALIFDSIQELSQNLLKENKIKKFQYKTKPKYIKKQPK